jgi:hypothetical protein
VRHCSDIGVGLNYINNCLNHLFLVSKRKGWDNLGEITAMPNFGNQKLIYSNAVIIDSEIANFVK